MAHDIGLEDSGHALLERGDECDDPDPSNAVSVVY